MLVDRLITWFQGTREFEPTELRRRRKLVGLLLVVALMAALSGGLQLAHGVMASAVACAVGLVLLGSLLCSLRRGAAHATVLTVFLIAAQIITLTLSLRSGQEGPRILLWLAVTPVIALTVGGTRVGYLTLGVAVLVIAIGVYGAHHQWVEPPAADTPTVPTIFSATGLLTALFLIVKVYETEMQRGVEELRAQNLALELARAEADRLRVEAVRANQAKSEFVATISHELRTPLNGVIGMAALLHDEQDPALVREGLRIIESSADTLRLLISDVLDFAKIENGQVELVEQIFSPGELIRSSVEFVRPKLEPGVELEAHVAPSVPAYLKGDVTRLRQVLLNLLANAVKFTRAGKVECTATYSDEGLQLAVRDTGIGIDREHLSRLGQQAFHQLDRGANRAYDGVGLGLHITRRLLERFKGALRIDSERGKGSTFTAVVPLPRALPPSDARRESSAPHGLTVLVAEDNPINQLVIKGLLEKLGHRVRITGDGRAAVESVEREGAPDVMLMDCHMPIVDGFEATNRLRARGCSFPIHALTASVSTDDLERCRAVGMNGVLAKPIDVRRLQALLEELTPTAGRDSADT